MSVFKATQNANGSSNGTFKATKKKSYDSSIVYEWESANRESSATLGKYYKKISNNEYMSKEDIEEYREALDRYIESSNNLRTVNRSFGGETDDDESWQETVTSLKSGFESANEFWSHFESQDDYDTWLTATTKKAETTKKQEEERAAVLGADDFEKYFSQGNEYGEEQSLWDKLTGKTYNSVSHMRNDPEALAAFEEAAKAANGASWGSPERILTNQSEYKAAKYMTDDEFKVYNYYYAKDVENGTDTASEFLKSIEETLNERAALEKFADLDGRTIEELLFGITAGLDQFESGAINLFDVKSDYIPASPTQMTSAMVREDLADTGFNLPERMGGASIGQAGYDMVTTTSNMLPSILTSSAANILVPGSGTVIGAGLLGASASGNAYAEMLNLGYDKGQARAYSVLVGASEAGLQYALGGIDQLGGILTGGAVSKFVNQFDNAIAKVAIKLGGNMMSEGVEEALQAVLEPVFKSITTGEEFEGIAWEEVIYSGLLGALTAGVFEGGPTIAKTAISNSQAKSVYGADAQALVGESLEIDPDNAYAKKMQTKLDGGKSLSGEQINRLVDANEQALKGQDISKMKAAAEARLTELGETGDISKLADVIVKAQSGGKLTSAERTVLVNSKYGRRVSTEMNPKIVKTGEYTSGWAENIGTERINAEAYNKELYNLAAKKAGVSVSVDVDDDDPVAAEASAQQPQAIAATENAPVEQPAAESEFSVSETGKTTYNGTEVKVAGVASVENGEVMVRLDNGKVVNARDVEFGREDDALLYEAVADMDMDVDAANDYIQGFNSMKGFPLATPQSVSSYMLGFREAHTYGRLGIPSEALARDGKYSVELSDGQRQIAYNRGSIERINEAKAAQSAVSEKTVKANKTYKDETHVSKIKSSKAYKNLSDTQKASLDGLTAIYKALGIDVYLFESHTDAKGKRLGKNGYYNPEDKSVHIDLYAGNDGRGAMIFTTGHELTHFIKDLSPEKFKKFADILFERLEKEGHSVAALIAKKRKFLEDHGRITPEMSETEANDLAREEAVADACETMLADGDAFAEIAERIHAKDKGLWNAIKRFFNNLVAKIKNAYADLDPDSIVGQQVAEMLDTAEELRSLWVDMLVEASEVKSTLSEVVEADAKPISTDEIITDGAVVTDGNGTKYSIRSMKHDISNGQMFRDLMEHCGFTKEQVGELRRQLEDLVEYMNPYRDIVDLNETYGREGRRYSPYKPNSDPLYTISLDFSTQCSKRLLTQYVIEQLQLRENRPMSPEEQMAIRDMLKEYGKVEKGLQVACVMCYVEAARLKAPKQIQKWLDDPATAMRNYFADKNPEFSAYIKEKQADFKESRGYDRDATKKDMSDKDRTALNKIRPRLRAEYNPSADEQAIIDIAASLPNSTYLTAGNLADLSETHPEIYKAYTSFIRTATRSKALETDEPYYYGDSTRDNGNGIIVRDSFIEAVNRENGMRFYSWSDWRIQHMLDWITAVIDNSVRGAAMHGYTKYGDEVRVLGKTGMMFNMSGVAGTQTGLNEDGSLNFSETESMDYDEAIELREEFPETAGLQCIGVGMDHIFALLRSDVIDYVIPYHTSGLNATLRRMGDIYGWKDFTYAQHATEDKRIKKENAVDPDHWHQEPVFSEFFVGYDTGLGGVEAMRKSAENYKRMCRERGLTPKFNEFANEPNYWKLLIDRKMVNQKTNALIRQRAVTPDFDFGVIKGIVDKYVANYDSGLEQRAFNHIVENWDNIPKRIRDLKKQGSTKTKSTKKAIDKLANEPVAVQPKDGMKASDRDTDYYSYENYSASDYYTNGTIYSYDFLTAQKEMVAVELPKTGSLANRKGQIDDSKVLSEGTKNSLSEGVERDGKLYVKNVYTGRELRVDNSTIKHGLDGTYNRHLTNARIGSVIGSVVKNAIPINGLRNTSEKAIGTYAMVSYCYDDQGRQFVAVVTVEQHTGNVDSLELYDVAHAVSGRQKKGSQVDTKSPGVYPIEATTISIAQLLEIVNSTHQSILSDDVLNRLGETRNPNGGYSDKVLFSDRDPDSISTRELLANALESVAQNDIERAKLEQYKRKIALIEEEQAKLAETKAKIKELSFAKGRRDTEAIKKLQFEANQSANRINTYDRQLLTLESTAALKGVIEREKQLAYKKAERKGKEALARQRERDAVTQRELLTRYQESRKKGVEGRKKTDMRHEIKTIASELDTMLRKPTAKKHIKEELRAEVADALLAINMDTVGADERVAHYNEMIAKAKDPDIIAELTKTRDRIQLQGDNLKEKFAALHTAYEKIKASDDIELSMSYQEVIKNSIKNVTDKVGNTSIRNMTLEQLEMVYDLFSMIRKTIRNANKAFNEQKGQTIMQMAEAVCDQVRTIGGQPYKRNAAVAALQREGWHLLKPYVAFRTVGSITLTNLYKELRNGEDTFYGDVKEAQAFIEEQYKKHGYKSWDMKKTKTFTAKSGKSFDLTLEQMMTLYAYSRREKAHKHIIEGGIVFEDSMIVEKNKWGVPIKYEVTTKDAFNLSEETFAEIANSLTAEQKAFVDAMQEYLSKTMGAKGNEVSMEMLGVKLFKEEFYLPVKSSQYYRNFSAEEAGEVKLKSPAFSKETVPHANNPIVLHNFTDLWAEHINDMSMYHAFVLALEDFTRVYNYKTKTDAKVETMDTKATLETAYPGVTNYISKFLKDMNGGVRAETVGWAEKLTSLAKKGSVLGSASVAIQQPSAVMRAMAYINPKYFVTTAHESINLAKHKQDWEELKKYAPIAGIKEMGRFDVGMGQQTVDWIKSNKTVMNKVEDVLSAAPAFMDEVTWVGIWNAVKRETVHNRKDLRPGSDEFLKVAGERFTDVISLSQVYDSVFSRSDLMRNKSWIAKSLTAFMAEPSTTMNMIWDSWVQAKRSGSVKGAIKTTTATGGAIAASIVLNAALKSIIMAMRDDDEDESYAEKYLEHFVGDLKDNLNPLTLVPVVKDVVSIFSGYDVERMDMAVVSDLKNAMDAFDSDSKTLYEKWSGFIGAISAFFGVPVKNVERDIRGLINTIFGDTESTTKAGLLNAIAGGWTGESKSNGQQLYEAMVNGDAAQIERIKGRYEDQKEVEAAIRAAIREYDPRIREAAQAVVEGNPTERVRIQREIISEKHFDMNIVIAATNAEIDYVRKKITEARAAKKAGKDFNGIVDILVERGYPEDFVMDALE